MAGIKLPTGPGSRATVTTQGFIDASADTRIKPGEVKNPYGRKGKNGTGGVSLRTEFKAYLNRLSVDERDAVWAGLYNKAMLGDVPALKMLVELNGEQVNEQKIEAASGAQIVINIPQAED